MKIKYAVLIEWESGKLDEWEHERMADAGAMFERVKTWDGVVYVKLERVVRTVEVVEEFHG